MEAAIVAKYVVMAPLLDERTRRLWAAAESAAIGYGGDALVSSATGLARQTICNGRRGRDHADSSRRRRETWDWAGAARRGRRIGGSGGTAHAGRSHVAAAVDV